MKDMNAGVEAFRAKLQALGAKKYWTLLYRNLLHEEHSISTDNLRLFGFLLMDLMMAAIMLPDTNRNTTCINIPLKGN